MWFIGKEVAAALGYADLTHAVLDHVYEEGRMNSKAAGLSAPEFGQRGTWLVNESGIYSLVFGSQLPKGIQYFKLSSRPMNLFLMRYQSMVVKKRKNKRG